MIVITGSEVNECDCCSALILTYVQYGAAEQPLCFICAFLKQDQDRVDSVIHGEDNPMYGSDLAHTLDDYMESWRCVEDE